MKRTIHLAVLLVSVTISACASSAGSKPTDDTKKTAAKTVPSEAKKSRTEDLSAFRPKFPEQPAAAITAAAPAPVTPVNHVNQQADALLDTLAVLNKNVKYAQGYRILAYTGADRKQALELRRTIINTMPEERDYLTFSQPTYKLKIGDYYTRMEANTVLQRIKRLNPSATILREQINVNRPAK